MFLTKSEIKGISTWINSKPLVLEKLKGSLKIDSPKLYNLHKTEKPEEHELKLVFKAKGVKCYAYTFGYK